MLLEETKHRLLDLPPPKETEAPKEKRYAGEPDLSLLNEDQTQALQSLQDFVRQEKGGLFVLQGHAGTGKTYTISIFVEWYLNEYRTKAVAVTAPTNKAVRVQYQSANYQHTNLSYLTVHKLLGLKEQIDVNGNQVFKQDPTSPPKIDGYSLLIVDEVSMLSDELFDMLYPYTIRHQKLKILFVGDQCQINPINKLECIPLDLEWQELLQIGKSTLTTIVRQAEGNPIIELATLVRTNLSKNTAIKDRTNAFNRFGSVTYINPNDDEDRKLFGQVLKTWFCSENFYMDSNFCKVIAWRNATVDSYNKYIRKLLYGKDAKKLEIGEKLIANTPIMEEKRIIFTTNEEFEVVRVSEGSDILENGDYVMKYYFVEVITQISTGEMMTKYIKVIHEESEAEYMELLELLKQHAISSKKGSYDQKKAYISFYEFKEMYADIKYNYALSAHKSQGSTYQNVIIIESDIDLNKKVVERNRIKYTAITRPTTNLVILK